MLSREFQIVGSSFSSLTGTKHFMHPRSLSGAVVSPTQVLDKEGQQIHTWGSALHQISVQEITLEQNFLLEMLYIICTVHIIHTV